MLIRLLMTITSPPERLTLFGSPRTISLSWALSILTRWRRCGAKFVRHPVHQRDAIGSLNSCPVDGAPRAACNLDGVMDMLTIHGPADVSHLIYTGAFGLTPMGLGILSYAGSFWGRHCTTHQVTSIIASSPECAGCRLADHFHNLSQLRDRQRHAQEDWLVGRGQAGRETQRIINSLSVSDILEKYADQTNCIRLWVRHYQPLSTKASLNSVVA